MGSPPPPDGRADEDSSDDAAAQPKGDRPVMGHRHTMPPQSATERQSLLRLASAGFELASFSLILGGAGYGVDYWMGNATPYVGIAGVMVGFCLGFYRLIVLASKMG